MAAVTVVRKAEIVIGSLRLGFYTVTAAATGDTLSTGLRLRYASAGATPAAGTAVGCSYTAGARTLTFVYAGGGAATAFDVFTYGY